MMTKFDGKLKREVSFDLKVLLWWHHHLIPIFGEMCVYEIYSVIYEPLWVEV